MLDELLELDSLDEDSLELDWLLEELDSLDEENDEELELDDPETLNATIA